MQNNFKAELTNTLNTLTAEREHWETGVYKQANEALYEILEKCSNVYSELKEDKSKLSVFNALAEERGVKFTKGTSLALKLVRLLFGENCNREFAYACVLNVWFNERGDGQTLTNFVIERGGIESVRRKTNTKVSTTMTVDDYRDVAAEALTGGYTLATFGLQDYMLSDDENDTDYVVALVRKDGQGNGGIVYGSNKRGLVNNALAVMGKEIDELQRKTASKNTLDDVKQKKAADIKKFIARIAAEKTAA